MQTKLHQWATADPGRRFDDLSNLVYDPAFLVVAWSRVRGNKGARTAGVDGVAPRSIVFGAGELLGGLRDDLKAGRFVPQRVREKTIPKAAGKVRALGIPTTADRVVQASLKLVLEPIFEADFKPCSYGFRPKRRAQDAIAEIHYLGITHPELRVGVRGGHQGVLRRDRPHRPHGPGATSDRGQACPGLGEGVPAGRDPHRGGPQPGDDHRHTPRRDPLTAAGQHRPVRAGRALRRQVGSARPGMDTRQASPRRRPGHEARPLRGRLRGHGRTAPATTPKRSGTRSARCSLRWACACRRRRRGSATSTRGSTSSAGASSADAWRGRTGKRAVYTYPSKKALASIIGQGAVAHPPRASIERSPTCCAG